MSGINRHCEVTQRWPWQSLHQMTIDKCLMERAGISLRSELQRRSMRLILARHGESTGNFDRRLQGQGDYPLTELGREQSYRLGHRLAREKVAAIYSSAISRAMETAEIVGEVIGLAPQALAGVEEYHFGELSGLTYPEIAERNPEVLAGIRSRESTYPAYPGEEGREVFRRRVSEALTALGERHPEETIAVITHAGPIVTFVSDILGRPYVRPVPFRMNNASITIVESVQRPDGSSRRLVLQTLNDTCHLEGERTGGNESTL